MLQNVRSSVQTLWQRLSWGQRLTIIGLSGAVVAAMALVMLWANAPTYVVLSSGLSAQDANKVVTQLETDKVPYQLADGGTTVLVPQAMQAREQLQLAGQSGPIGWSLFDQNSIFQGDSFTEQINKTRALEGELTQTIEQISGVQYARVNLVLPEQQLFSSQQADPTASVLLKLDPGAALTGDQVSGIQHLVADAVESLKPENVTVVDGSGNILSGNAMPSDASATGLTALQAEAQYASNLEAQLTAMLDTVVGPDRAVVRVSDVMDWTQREYTSNTYAPQKANSPVSTSHVVSSTQAGPGNAVGGVVGLASNVPTYGTKAGSTSSMTQTQGTADYTYANSNTVSHVVEAPGAVQQLSIAVLLNGVSKPREIAALRQAVSAAAGLNFKRGDQLSISAVPFDNSVATSAASAAQAQQQQALIVGIVRWLALIIVPLILLFLLRRLLVPARLKTYDAAAYPDIEVLEQGQETPQLAAPEEEAPTLPGPSPMRQSMVELAREKPEVVAGLIGRWIEEDRG